MKRTFTVACVFFCSYGIGLAQVPIVIKAARLIDVETGQVMSNQVILVEGEKIKAVGTTLPVPAGARVIDLSNATVLPGLIDAHSHLLADNCADGSCLNQMVTQMSTAKRALLGAAKGREVLQAGITTVRDLGNSGWNGDVALRDAINSGWIVGPRMVVSTRAIAPVGGQFVRVTPETRNIIEQEYAQITGADEARRAVRQATFDKADCIKIIADYNGISLALDELKAIVEEAHAARRKVAAHAIYGGTNRSARLALEAGVDSIEHGSFLSEDELKTMAEKKVFLVNAGASWELYLEAGYGNSPFATQSKAFMEQAQKTLRRAIELGVPVAAGSDAGYDEKGRTRGEVSIRRIVRSFRESGVSPLETVRAATIRAAELLGWQDRIGSLKEGKFADLIAVRGDPLQDITVLEHVTFVLKSGVVIKNDLKP